MDCLNGGCCCCSEWWQLLLYTNIFPIMSSENKQYAFVILLLKCNSCVPKCVSESSWTCLLQSDCKVHAEYYETYQQRGSIKRLVNTSDQYLKSHQNKTNIKNITFPFRNLILKSICCPNLNIQFVTELCSPGKYDKIYCEIIEMCLLLKILQYRLHQGIKCIDHLNICVFIRPLQAILQMNYWGV